MLEAWSFREELFSEARQPSPRTPLYSSFYRLVVSCILVFLPPLVAALAPGLRQQRAALRSVSALSNP